MCADRRRVGGRVQPAPAEWLAQTDGALGRLWYALPPVSFEGGPLNWARPPGHWEADTARWA